MRPCRDRPGGPRPADIHERGPSPRAWTPGLDALAQGSDFRFAKRGDLRLISHHDLMRSLERTMAPRWPNFPSPTPKGFNPRPESHLCAWPLPWESKGTQRNSSTWNSPKPIDPSDVLKRLQDESPAGFDFLSARVSARMDPEAPGPRRAALRRGGSFRPGHPRGPPRSRRSRRRGRIPVVPRVSCPYTRRSAGSHGGESTCDRSSCSAALAPRRR